MFGAVSCRVELRARSASLDAAQEAVTAGAAHRHRSVFKRRSCATAVVVERGLARTGTHTGSPKKKSKTKKKTRRACSHLQAMLTSQLRPILQQRRDLIQSTNTAC